MSKSKMVLNAFLGKKEICRLMLNHPAAKLQISSKMRSIAENYGHLYIRLFGYPLDSAARNRARKVLSYLSERRGKVLDIGCSFGVFAFELARRGYSVIGVDVNPQSIELANKITKILKLENACFINMGFPNVKFSTSEFDIVIMVEVLEHIKDDCQVIQEIHRILRNNGILVISVPYTKEVVEFSDSPSLSFITREGKKARIGVPGELHFRSGYNFERLVSLLKSNGFTVVHYTYTKTLEILPRSMILFPLSYMADLVFSDLSKNIYKLTVLAKKNRVMSED